MLEWAGISFGEENTLKLAKSIKVSGLACESNKSIICTEIGNHEWS